MRTFFTSFLKARKIALVLLCMPFFANAQILLYQDFSTSTVVADYVGTGQNQFDFIGTSGTGASSIYFNATSGKLTFQRSGPTLAMVKTTALSTPSPTLLRIGFKINAPFGSLLTGTNAIFYVGNGLFAGAATTGEVATTNRHSIFGVTFGANVPNTCGGTAVNTKEFYIRSTSTVPVVNSPNYICEKEINWFINNSGTTITYADMAGGMSTLVDDAADIWVGNTRVFAAIPAVNPAATLDNFKFLFNNGDGAITIDDLIMMTGANALPVAISSIKAAMSGAANQINWSTASEFNNKGFYIERQSKTGVWESIGFVAGSNKAATYTYKDNSPLQVSNYRLRQVDYDGKESFSSVVSVTQKFKDRVSITPNPTSNVININLNQMNLTNTLATVVLYDLAGRKVLTQQSKTGTIQLDLTNVPKGTYVLNVMSDNITFNEKIVKQ